MAVPYLNIPKYVHTFFFKIWETVEKMKTDIQVDRLLLISIMKQIFL